MRSSRPAPTRPATTRPDKEECDRKKSMMQLMQSMDQGACKRHTDGQVAACKCVKPDEAPARRLKTIKEVYEKNGGDLCGNQPVCRVQYVGASAVLSSENFDFHTGGDAAKAEGLAAKADTSKKFGALLHKLVAKYPAMIKKVADPQQEYWEKIMKEGIDKKASTMRSSTARRRTRRGDDLDAVADAAEHDVLILTVVC